MNLLPYIKMRLIEKLISVLLFLSLDFAAEAVYVNMGTLSTILGTENRTWTGEIFYAFRGIPYAKPPIGNLRFKVFPN